MIVDSKPFGAIEVDERQILYFPYGILGFEHLRKFALLDATQPPFYWLQSLEQQEIAFVLIDPAIFRPDYDPDIQKEDQLDIGIKNDQDRLIFSIVTIPGNQEMMTANLQGPIVVNKHTKQSRQCISSDSRWKVKHYVLEELSAIRNEAC